MFYDKYNVQEFNEKGHAGKYICCVCGQLANYSNSVSSKGKRLIHVGCQYKLSHLLDMDTNEVMSRIHREECDGYKPRETV